MIRILLAGLWGCAVALGSSWAVANYRAAPPAGAAVAHADPHDLELRRAKPVNIPIVADGGVQGYVIAEFSFTIDKTAAKTLPVSPEAVLLDEAFRAIYSDRQVNFRNLQRYDLDRLTKVLVDRVRARLKSDAVKEVMVQEFNFVATADIRQ